MMKHEYRKLIVESIRPFAKEHLFASFLLVLNTGIGIILPIVFKHAIDEIVTLKRVEVFLKLIVLYLLIIVLSNVLSLVVNYNYSKIGLHVTINLKTELIKKFLELNCDYHDKNETGELMSIIDNDVNVVQEFANSLLYSTFADILSIVVMVLYLGYIQLDLLVVAVLLQPLVIPVQKYFNEKSYDYANRHRDIMALWKSLHFNMLSKIKYYKIYNVKTWFFRENSEISNELFSVVIKKGINNSMSSTIISILAGLSFLATLSFGGYKVLNGVISIGVLTMFLQYSQRILGPLQRLARLSMKLKMAEVSFDRVCNVFYSTDYLESSGERENNIGEICFNDVWFRYNENADYVIKGISLRFSPGKKYFIVGESGSGKSTILDLILRLREIDKGEIEIDGKNIREYDIDCLRKNISVISQEPFIINDTVSNNITFGDEEYDSDSLRLAYREAKLDIFQTNDISNVKRNGLKLSGGQKQRVEIARGFYENSSVLVLDEPTSALDVESEKVIKESLNRFLCEEKVIIIVTHRLSMIGDNDEIILLNNGIITESGTHKELYNRKEGYYQLYSCYESGMV